MFRKILTFVLFSLSFTLMEAQNKVIGKLVDANTQEPEPGAVVQLYYGSPTNENMKAYALSDSSGTFDISLKSIQEGEYIVQIVNLGRKTVERRFIPVKGTNDLGTIALEDDEQVLNSSKVTAAKPLVKMDADKISYDVESDADSKATTVLEMLRKVPMVTVDGQDNITVNGSSSFKVYVDGKPNQMLSSNASKIFKAMPAAAVKNIEVITNPGAKYDAEGTGGVLNLIIAKTEEGKSAIPDGANGSISAGVDSRGSLNGGIYLNAKKGKFTIGGNIYAGLQNQDGSYMESTQNIESSGLSIKSGGDVKDQSSSYIFGDLNANYELDSLNLISASLGLSTWGYKQDASAFVDASTGGSSIYNYTGSSNANGGSKGMDASLDWQHNFSKEKMLTLSYRYSGDPRTEFSESTIDQITGTTIYDRKVDGDHVSQEHTVQADYTTPIGPGQTLSSGLKYIYRNNYSDDEYYLDMGSGYELQAVPNSEYTHRNHIAAAYSEYAANFGVISFKAGLRYEYTWLDVEYADGNSYNSHYDNFVPNASLQLATGMTSNIGLTYNMRIRRPGISYLNPFVNRGSTTAISYGNPDIEPEKTHSTNLKYNFFSPKIMLSAGVGYRFGEGGIASYQKYAADPEDPSTMILHNTYGNIISTKRLNSNIFVNWNPAKDTRIYSSIDAGYSWLESDILAQKNKGFNGTFMIGGQQTIFWDLRLSANIFTSTRNYSLQGWNSGFSGASIGITKNLLDEKLSISLRGFSNLVGGEKANFRDYSEGDGFSTESIFKVPLRSVGVSVTYNFGKNQIQVKKVQRSISNDDLMEASRSDSTPGGATTGAGTQTQMQ